MIDDNDKTNSVIKNLNSGLINFSTRKNSECSKKELKVETENVIHCHHCHALFQHLGFVLLQTFERLSQSQENHYA